MADIKDRESDIAVLHKAILAAAPEITHPNPVKLDSTGSKSTDIAIFK